MRQRARCFGVARRAASIAVVTAMAATTWMAPTGMAPKGMAPRGGMAAEPAAPIGAAETVVRNVDGLLAAQRRNVVIKDPVFRREVIETGADSLATLRFLDKTTLTTGANSTVTLDEFVYAGGSQRAAVTVSKGIMRFVTGSMASSAYEITSPTAIIGVRGTAFAVGTAPGADQTNLVKCDRGTITVTLKSGAEIELTEGQCVAFDSDSPPTGRPCTPAEEERAADIAAQQKINGQGDDQDFTAAAANMNANNTARELTAATESTCTGC